MRANQEIIQFTPSHHIHDLGIGFGQLHAHGVNSTGEFEGVRVLTVLLLIQSLCCCLGFFHLQRANRDPASSLD